MLCEGMSSRQIAARRECSPRTVEVHRSNIDGKIAESLGLEGAKGWNAVKRFIWAIEQGFVDPPKCKVARRL